MARTRLLSFLIAVATVVAAGCGGSGSGNPTSAGIDYDKALADAPAPLAKLYAKGDELIPGSVDELNRELAALKGHPVVVNAWASWCGPCRFEFPYFQQASAKFGDRVAFLGVNSYDSDAAADTFLKELPLPYPSVTDPDKQVWPEWDIRGLPATAFYDSSGKRVYVRPGPYSSVDELAADIQKYAQ